MNGTESGYYIETGYGFDPMNSTCSIYSVDQYNRIHCIEMVFRGSWEDCIKYAKSHSRKVESIVT